MKGLHFDPLLHRYTYDGVEVPGVTSLLPEQNFFVSRERLDETVREGNAQHDTQEALLNGEEVPESDFSAAFAYLMETQATALGKALLVEQPLYSKRYRFAGKPDAVFEGGLADRKRSRGNSKIRALQFAGYWILLEDNGFSLPKRWWEIVYDEERKRDVPKNIYSPTAINVFLSLVQNHWNRKLLNAYLKVA